MKRILLLIKGLGKGGAEQLLVSALRYADRSRFHYDVAYLLPWKDDLVPELEDMGIRVHCLDGARGVGWVGRLPALVGRRGIGLVHAHSPYPAIGARLGLRGRGRLVYTEHNVWERYHRATYWGNVLTFPRNHHVFAVSEQVRTSIQYPGPLRALRMPPVETLYHGPDPATLALASAVDGVREELGIPEGVPVVGTVAHLKPHKGHQHLLRAAAEVRRARPDARFVLVGRGPLESELRQLTSRLGLDGSVVLTGFRDDALRIASAFDLFVLPSEHEGLPIALLEAMAIGKPVVVTRVGGNAEVVEDGVNGLVVPPENPPALAGAITLLLRDPPLRERLGEAARRRAADFDIRTAIRRMEEVYEEMLP